MTLESSCRAVEPNAFMGNVPSRDIRRRRRGLPGRGHQRRRDRSDEPRQALEEILERSW